MIPAHCLADIAGKDDTPAQQPAAHSDNKPHFFHPVYGPDTLADKKYQWFLRPQKTVRQTVDPWIDGPRRIVVAEQRRA
jgi:hypothetical protein